MGRKLALVFLCLLLLLSIGCQDKITQGNNTNEEDETLDTNTLKMLRIASSEPIITLDTSIATDRTSFEVLGNTMEGLFVLTGGNELKNGVCESYTISEDGKTYTFKLRKDSVWSNGESVTAHDFVYSWMRLGDPKTDSQYSFMLETANIRNSTEIIRGDKTIEKLGVKAEDDYTLVVELDHPVPYLPSVLSHPIFLPLKEKFVTEKGESFSNSVEKTLFNGPYYLIDWSPTEEYTYKKNENYWDKDSIIIEEINVRIIKDSEKAVDMYINGKIDYITLPYEQAAMCYSKDYSSSFPYEDLISVSSTAMYYLELNQNNDIMKNANVRKAIALSIEKSVITNEILKNGSLPADYLIPRGLAVAPDGIDFRDSTKSYNHYNLEDARKYWEKGKNELGIDTANIVYICDDIFTQSAIADYIKEQLESNLEGLTVEIKYFPMYSSQWRPEEGTEDILFYAWGPDYSDPMTFLDMWVTTSSYNYIGYSNNEYDSIIESAKTGNLTLNPQKRWSELQRAEKILLEDDVVIIPLYQRGELALLKSYVKNWQMNSFGPHRYWGSMDIEE